MEDSRGGAPIHPGDSAGRADRRTWPLHAQRGSAAPPNRSSDSGAVLLFVPHCLFCSRFPIDGTKSLRLLYDLLTGLGLESIVTKQPVRPTNETGRDARIFMAY